MTEEKKEEQEGGRDENSELLEIAKKAEEYLNGWKRAKADYINREKEIVREKEIYKTIIEEAIVLNFLPILDNLKSALSSKGENDSVWREGVERVKKQFEDLLKEFGFEKLDLLGKEFDLTFSEAVERQGEGNMVIKVARDGYKKGGRAVRAAKVIVG